MKKQQHKKPMIMRNDLLISAKRADLIDQFKGWLRSSYLKRLNRMNVNTARQLAKRGML